MKIISLIKQPEMLRRAATVIFLSSSWIVAGEEPVVANESAETADEKFVAEIHAASLARREQILRDTIAEPTVWPGNRIGDLKWSLSALMLNEKLDDANARILKHAQPFVASYAGLDPAAPSTSVQLKLTPWSFLSSFDYVRMLCLFHSRSPHYPGRLTPEAEAAMKEALWQHTSRDCKLANNGLDDVLLLRGTENHNLNLRPLQYLALALLAEDPAYRDRMLADGHSLIEHVDTYTKYFREWPRQWAQMGLWVELGSTGYQKYSWPALFNLHELSPDAVIRERFGKYLDLTFIEEEQISVGSRRGGGRTRSEHKQGGFEGSKNLLIDPAKGGGGTHSRTVDTSRYQAPAVAILMRHRKLHTDPPFVIRNRVPGETGSNPEPEKGYWRVQANSALANYAYRTPHYLFGSLLHDPTVNYAGVSRQNRTCGMLLDNPAAETISQIYPLVEHGGGGRSQNSYFSFQQKNVLIVQRIARRDLPAGSYATGKISVRFDGDDLRKVEENGWIFTTNDKAHAAVKFLDGGHQWNEKKSEALPANYTGHADTGRILFHAGDISTQSFDEFRASVLANPLTVTADNVDYRFGAPQEHIEIRRYNAAAPQDFVKPLINGTPLNLRPSETNPLRSFDSPFLSMENGSNKAVISYPGLKDVVLDF